LCAGAGRRNLDVPGRAPRVWRRGPAAHHEDPMTPRLIAALTVCLLFGPVVGQDKKGKDDKDGKDKDAKEVKDVKEELKKLQGAWKLVKFESADKKVPPPDFFPKGRFFFDGDKLKIVFEGKEKDGCAFKIDPNKSPKHIDITPTTGKNKGKASEGIYTLEGDKLTICSALPGDPRPEEFAVPEGSKAAVFHLEREKK
jgi:uncharacterized protein (TIGR03067 family)